MIGLIRTVRLWGVYAHTPISMGVMTSIMVCELWTTVILWGVYAHTQGLKIANDEIYTVNLL